MVFNYHIFLDRHAPVKTRRVKNKRLPDWLTQEILDTRKLRDNKKKLKNWADYTNYRNKKQALIQKAKRKYFSDSIINSKESKHLWKLLRSMADS